jgi:hypothetical protein
LSKLLGSLEAIGEQILDVRWAGGNLRYQLLDGMKNAFAFLFLHPSLLDFQRVVKEQKNRNTMETLLRVVKIPRDNQIRMFEDGIEASVMGEVFEKNLRIADEAGSIEGYGVLDGGVLLALDGLWYYVSKEIHCEYGLHTTNQNGETTDYYDAGVIVKPGSEAVVLMMAEPIENGNRNRTVSMKRGIGGYWPIDWNTDGLR